MISRKHMQWRALIFTAFFGASLAGCGEAGTPTDLTVNDSLKKIAIAPLVSEDEDAEVLTRTEAAEDLDQLAEYIRTQHSYIHSTDFDYINAIAFLKSQLPETVSIPVLGMQIQKLVQHLGDNHAQLRGWQDFLPQRFIPVSFGFRGDRVFMFRRDRSGLVDQQHPFVRSIDGVPMDQWVARAGDIGSGPEASVSQRWQRSLDLLEYVDFMRSELGLGVREEVSVILESGDRQHFAEHVFTVSNEREETGKPFGLTRNSFIMEKNIGYLRIHSQRNDELTRSIPDLMDSFRNTDALIIDARQCGGGLRSNLQALFPYFMSPDDEPYIANVAKLRVPDDDEDFDPRGKLDVGDKKLKYRDDADVTDVEAAALDRFLESFTPSWMPPEDLFTDWYFMAMVDRDESYFYDRPVFLIMDWGVGSAGDIFVSTFKSWRDITLVGTASNGRSGNSRSFILRNSALPVRLSTMASFQKTGEKYDGVGIQPDIVLEAEILDWLEQSDTVLDRVRTMATESRATAQ